MTAFSDAKPVPDFAAQFEGPCPSLSRLVDPPPLLDPALADRPSQALVEARVAARAVREARREHRLQLVFAGLAGGLVALALRRVIDRG